MATIEFDAESAGRLPLPSRSLVDAGPAQPTRVRARSWSLRRGPELVLPLGRREAQRLRLSWLATLATILAPVLAVVAIIGLLQFLGVLGDGRLPLPWQPLSALVVLNSVALATTHVAQRPTLRRGGVIRIVAVDDDVAAEWADLAGGRVRIVGSRPVSP